MRKYLCFLLTVSVLSTAGVSFAGEDAPAILESSEGKRYKVFLMKMDGEAVSIELQKLRQKKVFEKPGLKSLNFSHKKFNEKTVRAAFNNADYAQVIQTLAPVTQPYVDYMTVNNNLQELYSLLMVAYYNSGDFEQALVCADKLLKTDDVELSLKARVYAAISAAGLGAYDFASNVLKDIEDPAAALFVEASIERAQGQPDKAIRLAAEIVEKHKNDIRFMPPTEMLCSELYLEIGRTNSAFVTARQVRKLYKGMNVEKEAEALQSGIDLPPEQATEQPIEESTVDSE